MQSIAASWSGGSGPSALELIVCDWVKVALGLPTSCEGVLLSGGSMANITGSITARQMSGDGVVYLTDQTHASIHRGLPAIGQPSIASGCWTATRRTGSPPMHWARRSMRTSPRGAGR